MKEITWAVNPATLFFGDETEAKLEIEYELY